MKFMDHTITSAYFGSLVFSCYVMYLRDVCVIEVQLIIDFQKLLVLYSNYLKTSLKLY